jgi:hypothetical protein
MWVRCAWVRGGMCVGEVCEIGAYHYVPGSIFLMYIFRKLEHCSYLAVCAQTLDELHKRHLPITVYIDRIEQGVVIRRLAFRRHN